MRILVTFATEAEFAPWRHLRRFQKAGVAHLQGYSARVASAEVAVMLTGVGPAVAASKVRGLFTREDFGVCISSGLAGGLRPNHFPGEILASRRVGSARAGRTADCDLELLHLAAQCGAKTVESFCTSERILLTAREKSRLGSQAEAVEMESLEILEEAAAEGVRGVAIRAIADAVDEDLPLDFNRVLNAAGELSLARAVAEVARNPGSLPALMRFGRQSHWAAAQLGRFLDGYVAAVAQRIGRGAPKVEVAAG